MIFASYEPREVGKRYDNQLVSDGDGTRHRIPLLVLREATYDEWEAYLREVSADVLGTILRVQHFLPDHVWFYEVSTD